MLKINRKNKKGYDMYCMTWAKTDHDIDPGHGYK